MINIEYEGKLYARTDGNPIDQSLDRLILNAISGFKGEPEQLIKLNLHSYKLEVIIELHSVMHIDHNILFKLNILKLEGNILKSTQEFTLTMRDKMGIWEKIIDSLKDSFE